MILNEVSLRFERGGISWTAGYPNDALRWFTWKLEALAELAGHLPKCKSWHYCHSMWHGIFVTFQSHVFLTVGTWG